MNKVKTHAMIPANKRKLEQQLPHSAFENLDDETCVRIVTYIRKGYKVMILMRGLPGSGKTTLATMLLERGAGSVSRDDFILSTDDYFNRSGRYNYNADELQEAQVWNQRRAFANATRYVSPIIVDDNNLEIPEMRVYCAMSVQFGYMVEIVEMRTPWALNPKELFLKNEHGVDEEEIKSMLVRYQQGVTVQELLAHFGLVYPTMKDVEQDDISGFTPFAGNANIKIERQLDELKKSILEQSQEMEEMRSEIMEYLVFLTADAKTKVTFISEQLAEIKEAISSEHMKEILRSSSQRSPNIPSFIHHPGVSNKLQDLLDKGNASLTKLLSRSDVTLGRRKPYLSRSREAKMKTSRYDITYGKEDNSSRSGKMLFNVDEKDRMKELTEQFPNVPPDCILSIYQKCHSDLHWSTEVLNSLLQLFCLLGNHCGTITSSLVKSSGINFEAYTNGLIAIVIIVIIIHVYILF